MNDNKKWQHEEPWRVAYLVKQARMTKYFTVTPSGKAWTKPYDLHLFQGGNTEVQVETNMAAYGEEWRLVDFQWVLANVDHIDRCLVY